MTLRERLRLLFRRLLGRGPGTTKICPHCWSDSVVGLRSTHEKICNNCKREFPWPLDPGQKPL